MSFLSKLFDSSQVKSFEPVVEEINKLEPEFESKTQDDFRALTKQWQEEIRKLPKYTDAESTDKETRIASRREINQQLNLILPQAFAAVREAAKRVLNQRHFDVQLLGGMTLHRGHIAEMRTGEGKTLSSTLAVYLNALAGKGVHVVTVNDYLARRDASWMGQIYDYLGLSVGVVQHEASYKYQTESLTPVPTPVLGEDAAVAVQLDVKNLVPVARQEAYLCDITYATNNELGFDYLRDNMVQALGHKVQRRHYYAIVDEVDSILIDEARTPLIISAPDAESTDKYYQFSKIVTQLSVETDYTVDEKKRSVALTEEGIEKIEKILGVENIYVERGIADVHHIEQALRAKTLFKLDHHYVVREGQVVIVDEFTGRLMPGRRFSEGLHQALEAKEGLAVQRESKTLATITFQNFFRLYGKLAGMTGTAKTEEEEFRKIYGLDVYLIPTNKPVARHDSEDLVFKNEAGKFSALVSDVRARHEKGQPVLIGTVSIEKNEILSKHLAKAGVPHEMLNAKNHEREAQIIAQAGRKGAVTLATNIAGRGVDIILGGSPYNHEAAEVVRATGGLHVLGTERHESRRIDNQLRGRSGRQGDPGSSQFFVSLEDELIRLFGGERVQQMMTSLGIPDDQPIEHGLVSRVIESAQKKIEGFNFDVRKHVLEFDDVMNKQREVIYRIRDRALLPDANLKDEVLEKIRTEIANIVIGSAVLEEKQLEETVKTMASMFPFDKVNVPQSFDIPQVTDYFTKEAEKAYEEKEKQLTPPVMRAIERAVILRSIDSLWMEHIDTMEHLRASVRLRGYAQKDPLIEYKREGFTLFENLLAEVDKGVAHTIYKVEVNSAQGGRATPQSMPHSHSTGLPAAHSHDHIHDHDHRHGNEKIGRNQLVTIKNPQTGDTQQMKFKKAEKKIHTGWKLVSVDS